MILCCLFVCFQVKKELDDLRDKLQPLKMKYQKEKERIDEIRRLKQRREELLFTLQEAERRYDLARAADLRYGALQEIDAAIARLEGDTSENLMLTETVGPEHIAEVLTLGTLIEVLFRLIKFSSCILKIKGEEKKMSMKFDRFIGQFCH